jgi:CBS domain containing-hemolysin-like protein
MFVLFISVAVFAVAFGGLLAAVDAAISVLSRNDLAELATNHRAKRSLLAIAADSGAHLNAINFVRVFSEALAAVLVTLTFAELFEDWWWVLLASVVVVTCISFVLVGSSPRSVGRAHAKGVVGFSALIVRAIRVGLGPLASGLVALGNRVTPGRPKAAVSFSSEEQLLSMVDEATELDVLEEDDRELIHSIFEWGDTVVREVMVPRTDMVTIEADTTISAALGQFFRTGVSRIPVTGRDADEVLGVLYLRDVARASYEQPLDAAAITARDLARAAVFVPESKKADDTLRQMQRDRAHLAMVVDEYGGVAGLVTLEDLIEELVGDISDEYDRDTPDVMELSPGVYRVRARLATDALGDLFGIELDDDDVDSVGGLLAKTLGRLPVPGATATVSGLVITAERTEGRRKHLSTVVVERDAALIDAQQAFDSEEQR